MENYIEYKDGYFVIKKIDDIKPDTRSREEREREYQIRLQKALNWLRHELIQEGE